MSGRTTPEDETSPLLGHQGTESRHVASENTPETNDKKADGVNLVWVLTALWSAVFLGALDGSLPYQVVTA